MGGVQALQGAVYLLPSGGEVADIHVVNVSSPLLRSGCALSRTHVFRLRVLSPFST